MDKPNILIDDEIFIRQRFGGVSRIFIEILAARHSQHFAEIIFNTTYSENDYLQEKGLSKLPPYLKNYQFPLKGKSIRFIFGGLSHWKINRQLKSGNITIFHPSFYSDYFLKSLPSQTKLVFTLHDLTHEKSNDSLSIIKKKNLERADHIIVVSEQTKLDMIHFYPFTQHKKTSVIHLAQNLPETTKVITDLPKQYILFVGERGGYKNFKVLWQAFKKVAQSFPDLHLVCCGAQSFSSAESQEFFGLNLGSRIVHYKLSDAQLSYAYQHASIFVYPSLNEGFGIPTLEAMHWQVPSILSDISVFKEVAENAALYFNPNDSEQLSQHIHQILSNDLVRTELKTAAKERALNFSWQKHITKTFEVYQSLLS
jgi:glycosyltransferase involved in cell wall biosynthesis